MTCSLVSSGGCSGFSISVLTAFDVCSAFTCSFMEVSSSPLPQRCSLALPRWRIFDVAFGARFGSRV